MKNSISVTSRIPTNRPGQEPHDETKWPKKQRNDRNDDYHERNKNPPSPPRCDPRVRPRGTRDAQIRLDDRPTAALYDRTLGCREVESRGARRAARRHDRAVAEEFHAQAATSVVAVAVAVAVAAAAVVVVVVVGHPRRHRGHRGRCGDGGDGGGGGGGGGGVEGADDEAA